MVNLCYTCGSCDNECPINRRTGQLSPRKIVRTYMLGYKNEAYQYSEIWYCIQCGLCGSVCPMSVKPFEVIRELRDLWAQRNPEIFNRILMELRTLNKKFHHARYLVFNSLIKKAIQDEKVTEYADQWERLNLSEEVMEQPKKSVFVKSPDHRVSLERSFLRHFDFPTNIRLCLSCGSCTNACPVSINTKLFSPMRIFRMIELGTLEEIVNEPAVWLCIDCGRCMNVCPQKVKGLWILRVLREQIVSSGVIESRFVNLWKIVDQRLYREYCKAISKLSMIENG